MPLIPRQPMWSWHVRGPDFFRTKPLIRACTNYLRNLSNWRRTNRHLYRILVRLAKLVPGHKEDSSRDCPTFAFLSWFLRCERSSRRIPGQIGQDVQLRIV